jgi:hypothetical protein
MKNLVVWSAALALVCSAAFAYSAGADDAPKYKIKDVMAKCMKGGLCKKVADGNASAEEKKELLDMFTALAANKPPKGDDASWKEYTGALLAAAKEAHAGKDGAGDKLKKAANCAGCHGKHKPPA